MTSLNLRESHPDYVGFLRAEKMSKWLIFAHMMMLRSTHTHLHTLRVYVKGGISPKTVGFDAGRLTTTPAA